MSDYYDKAGKPMSMEEWAIRFEDMKYRKIGDTDVWGDGRTRVSTVWLGLDHSFGSGPPLIFETMVFFSDGNEEMMWRYSTLRQAKAGHKNVVNELLGIKNLVDGLLPERLD
jgi:hypothetical protein